MFDELFIPFEEDKILSEIFQKYLPFKAPPNFFWKSLKFYFSILSILKINKFEKKVVVFKKVVGRATFPSLVDIECPRLGVF